MSSGLPGISSLAAYGGQLADYAPLEDPNTDRPAVGANQAYADIAGVTHTAVRAWVRFVGTASTSVALASVNPHDATWGSGSGVAPVVSHTAGTGIFDITWPVTIVDELGVTQTVNLRAAMAPNIEGATPGFATLVLTGPNTARLRLFNTAGSLNDFVGATIFAAVI